ncbi:MAG: metallophosphoesterase [candidate division Zixibacteria bacterium]|nr:metallophosphoesterase [candidate division Zixibacteria bacterium]
MTRFNGILGLLTGLVLAFLACTFEAPDEPKNNVPRITSSAEVYAREKFSFRFTVTFSDPDGPDTLVIYDDYPSWLSQFASTLYGTPPDGTSDTGFLVIVSDGISADTENVAVIVIPMNDRPRIISDDIVEAAGGMPFCYRVAVADPDGPVTQIHFRNYPSWLTADADSIYGTPPDGARNTSFMVTTWDGLLADTLGVFIKVNPTMVVYGDTRTNHTIHERVVAAITPVQPAAVFHTGDLVEDGYNPKDWLMFNSITAELLLTAEFFPALGNHEKQAQLYFDNFDLPNNEQWYSVDRHYVHFIILNTCVAIDAGSEQYRWLESDLAAIPDSIRFVAVAFHHPPYSTGRHGAEGAYLQETLVPLFEKYGVDIVFSGHDHDYERSFCGGTYYIVTGGGGASLYDQVYEHPCSQQYLKIHHFCKLSVVSDTLTVKVYDIDGRLADQCEVHRRQRSRH